MQLLYCTYCMYCTLLYSNVKNTATAGIRQFTQIQMRRGDGINYRHIYINMYFKSRRKTRIVTHIYVLCVRFAECDLIPEGTRQWSGAERLSTRRAEDGSGGAWRSESGAGGNCVDAAEMERAEDTRRADCLPPPAAAAPNGESRKSKRVNDEYIARQQQQN